MTRILLVAFLILSLAYNIWQFHMFERLEAVNEQLNLDLEHCAAYCSVR